MKRKLFFFLERLQVQPREVRALSVVLLMALLGFRLVPSVQDTILTRSLDYREQDRLFLERTAEARRRYEAWREQLALAEGVDRSERDTSQKKLARPNRQEAVGEPSRSGVGRLNLNRATEQELQSLPGIGPAYARRIVEWRKRYGPYRSSEQLIEIRGIGEKRLERLRPLVRVTTAVTDSL